MALCNPLPQADRARFDFLDSEQDFDLAPPLLIGAAVDVVVQQEDSFLAGLGFPDTRTQLIVLAVITFLIWLLESLFEYLHSIVWRNLAQSVQHELRIDTYGHVQGLELAYFEDSSTGGLIGHPQRRRQPTGAAVSYTHLTLPTTPYV